VDDPNQRLEEVWIEVDLGNAWTAAYRITPQDGVPVIAELRVFPRESVKPPARRPGQWTDAALGMSATVPPGGLTTRLLRQLRGSDLRDGLAHFPQVEGVVTPAGLNLRQAGFHTLKRPTRLKGRGWSEETLLQAAVFYAKGGQHPVKDLATVMHLRPSQARDLLQTARNKGFLTPGRQGVRSRALTAKARERIIALAKEMTAS
jgi:hypothetical protein